MESSQGSTLSRKIAGYVDKSSSYEEAKYMDRVPLYVKELIAGGAAGAFAKTAVAPLERFKILLQTRTQGFHTLGVYQSLKKLLNQEEEMVLASFELFHMRLNILTSELYRSWILDNCSALGTGHVIDLLAGSAAGGTAVLFTYPLDLVRTLPGESERKEQEMEAMEEFIR